MNWSEMAFFVGIIALTITSIKTTRIYFAVKRNADDIKSIQSDIQAILEKMNSH